MNNDAGLSVAGDDAAVLELLLLGVLTPDRPPAYGPPQDQEMLRGRLGLAADDRLLVPPVLHVPDALDIEVGTDLALLDTEGATVATVSVTRTGAGPGGRWVAGPVRPGAPQVHRDWADLRGAPSGVAGNAAGRGSLAVWLDAPTSLPARAAARALAAQLGLGLLWLVPLPPDSATDRRAHLLPRLATAAVDEAAGDLLRVVPAPAAMGGPGDLLFRARIAAAYGAQAWALLPGQPADEVTTARVAELSGIRLLPVGDASMPSGALLIESVGAGRAIDPDVLERASVDAIHQVHPPTNEAGATIFFTGYSGSGKSTLARALVATLLATDPRPVTLLDGDVVRRHLSQGLGFDRAGRDANIRRIGFVAAEVTNAGGIAVCAPIAPFDATRRAVRAAVERVGTFVLVHVATPLAECERRDRKGLYARARAGAVGDFTGVTSPYEDPADAEIVVDTTGRGIDEALADVLAGLERLGVTTPSITTPTVTTPPVTTPR